MARVFTRLRSSPRELGRFLKFAVVGGFGAIVDFAVLNLMKWVLERAGLGVGWSVGLEPHQVQLVAANVVSTSVAILSNFTWNRLWTFPESRQKPMGSQLFQFSVVNVAGVALNTAIVLVMDRYVFGGLVSARMSYNLAKAFAIGVVLFWNFGVNRVWTYRGIK